MTNNSVSEELESYYPVRPECRDDMPKTRFKPRAGRTLSRRRWEAAFANDGHLDMAGVLKRIQRGGVHPSIKGEVWEFLLGCFDPNSTFEERKELRQQRREQYDAWKSECQKLVPIIGSGKFSMSPIITDDGLPVQGSNGNGNPPYVTAIPSDTGILDQKVKQWILTLPQIGWYSSPNIFLSMVLQYSTAAATFLWFILRPPLLQSNGHPAEVICDILSLFRFVMLTIWP